MRSAAFDQGALHRGSCLQHSRRSPLACWRQECALCAWGGWYWFFALWCQTKGVTDWSLRGRKREDKGLNLQPADVKNNYKQAVPENQDLKAKTVDIALQARFRWHLCLGVLSTTVGTTPLPRMPRTEVSSWHQVPVGAPVRCDGRVIDSQRVHGEYTTPLCGVCTIMMCIKHNAPLSLFLPRTKPTPPQQRKPLGLCGTQVKISGTLHNQYTQAANPTGRTADLP